MKLAIPLQKDKRTISIEKKLYYFLCPYEILFCQDR
jgi:hypothetical protein